MTQSRGKNAPAPVVAPVTRSLASLLTAVAVPVVIVAAWYVASRNSTALYFPPSSAVLDDLKSSFLGSGFIENVLPTLRAVALGLALATVAGIGTGYVIGTVDALSRACEPFLELARSVPPVILIPMFIAVFGLTATGEVLLIMWAAVWPILLSTSDAVRAVNQALGDTATALRMRPVQRFRYVMLPSAAPRIIPGINTALSIGLTAAVAIEMFSATTGIGRYLTAAQRNFDIAGSYAGVIAAGILGYGLSLLFRLLERGVLIPWFHSMQKAARQ